MSGLKAGRPFGREDRGDGRIGRRVHRKSVDGLCRHCDKAPAAQTCSRGCDRLRGGGGHSGRSAARRHEGFLSSVALKLVYT